MKTNEWTQIGLFISLLLAATPLLGAYMHRVFGGKPCFLTPLLGPLERLVYRLGGVDPGQPMRWTAYAAALLVFNAAGLLLLLGLQMAQAALPLNPGRCGNLPLPLAFNTAVSFVTNTNWQAYSGESTMSYLTQMAGLGVQNFLSAATGIGVLLALARGLVARSGDSLGNFWADLTRATLYVLLPLSLVLAATLASQGVPQTLAAPVTVRTLAGESQTIPLGPAASQIAIKQLGTNGGGFFGANSAHPMENPTPLSNFLQLLAILLIPAALTYTYGLMTGDRSQGWTLFAAMLALFLAGFLLSWWAESRPNPALPLSVNLEGKETRFGVMNSVLWSSATTAASNGSVNAMHDSLSPLAGGLALFNILLGEVVFGGVGAGLYGMLVFVILTVFLAGLMVGRTPEYLGKKIEAREVKWAVVAALAPSACILLGTALAAALPAGRAGLGNGGPHGLGGLLYAFASASGNNGSAFGSLGANTDFYNWSLALCMLVGRFAVIVPALAIAGAMAGKRVAPPCAGTFPSSGFTFGILLVAVVVLLGGLTFFPALALGPIAEHLLLRAGRTF